MTEDRDVPSARTRSIAVVALLPVVALVILVLDIVTKVVVVATLTPERPVEIIGDVVALRLRRNSGAAFSFATSYTWLLTLIAAAVVVGIVRFARRLRSRWWAVALGLVLGGAIGNLVDRLFRSPGPLRGHVVDFVSVGWWPVFNVADSAVVCGAVILVALTLFGVEIDGSRAGRRDHDDDNHDDERESASQSHTENPSAGGRADA